MHCMEAEDTDCTNTVLIARIKLCSSDRTFPSNCAEDDFLSKQILIWKSVTIEGRRLNVLKYIKHHIPPPPPPPPPLSKIFFFFFFFPPFFLGGGGVWGENKTCKVTLCIVCTPVSTVHSYQSEQFCGSLCWYFCNPSLLCNVIWNNNWDNFNLALNSSISPHWVNRNLNWFIFCPIMTPFIMTYLFIHDYVNSF